MAEKELQHRLEGPADTGHAGVAQCQDKPVFMTVDGKAVEVVDAEEEEDAGPDLNAAMPDPDFPEVALPAMHFCADLGTNADVDEIQKVRKVHAELEELQRMVAESAKDDDLSLIHI